MLATKNFQKDLFNTLTQMSGSLNCVKCSITDRKLFSISCGHLFCSNCIKSLDIPGNGVCVVKCPVCFVVIRPEEVICDELICELIENTMLLKDVYVKPFESCAIENNEKVLQVEYSEKQIQTDEKLFKSIEVQCDLNHPKKMVSVSTQTDSSNCCKQYIQQNLQTILEQNFRDYINNVMRDLLAENNGINNQMRVDVPVAEVENKSNQLTKSQEVPVCNENKIEDSKVEKLENTKSKTNVENINPNIAKVDKIENFIEPKYNKSSAMKTDTVSIKKPTIKIPETIKDLSSHNMLETQLKNKGRKRKIKSEASDIDVSNSIDSPLEPKRRLKKIVLCDDNVNSTEKQTKSSNDDSKADDSKHFTLKEGKKISDTNSASSVSSNSRFRIRGSPIVKPKYVILGSGLNELQKRKLEKSSNSLDYSVVKDWSNDVTHLVVCLVKNVPKKEMLSTRSVKYLMALLANKWIVSFEWITASSSSNRMVDEQKYEIKGVRNCLKLHCPKQSRTEKTQFLLDYAICFVGTFKDFPITIDDVKCLVDIGGGILVDNENKLSILHKQRPTLKMVVVIDNPDRSILNNSFQYISINDFLDAITNLSPIVVNQ